MKPDGTHTIDEVLKICNDELQSFERDSICAKLLRDTSQDVLVDFFQYYPPEYISTITGYYVYYTERYDVSEMDVGDFLRESNCGVYDLFDYIELNVQDWKLATWIAESDISKEVLLDRIDRNFLIEYIKSHFEIETKSKIIPIEIS